MNGKIEHKMREHGQPNRDKSGFAPAEKSCCEQSGQNDDRNEGMRPIIEESDASAGSTPRWNLLRVIRSRENRSTVHPVGVGDRTWVILPASNRAILSKFSGIMVARDGVEPPTPAFSVLRYAVF
jgi:hypothetical protein